MANLRVVFGRKHLVNLDLDLDSMVIGRLPTADLTLNDPVVSREHCRIELRDGRHLLIDMDSRSGTQINGEPVKFKVLGNGDEIVIGQHTLTYQGKAPGVEAAARAAAEEAATKAATVASGDAAGSGAVQGNPFLEQFEPPPQAKPKTKAQREEQDRHASSFRDIDAVAAQVELYNSTHRVDGQQLNRMRSSLKARQVPHLTWESKGQQMLFALEKDKTFSVGWDKEADFRLSGIRLLGRKLFHVHVAKDGPRVEIRTKLEPVKVRGKRIEVWEKLRDGDVIEAVGLEFRFREGV